MNFWNIFVPVFRASSTTARPIRSTASAKRKPTLLPSNFYPQLAQEPSDHDHYSDSEESDYLKPDFNNKEDLNAQIIQRHPTHDHYGEIKESVYSKPDLNNKEDLNPQVTQKQPAHDHYGESKDFLKPNFNNKEDLNVTRFDPF